MFAGLSWRRLNWGNLIPVGRLTYVVKLNNLKRFINTPGVSPQQVAQLMSSGRNQVKNYMRGSLAPLFPAPQTWAQTVTKYQGNWTAIQSAAMRSNPYWNTGVAAYGAVANGQFLSNLFNCLCQ